jgi:hypothetical protein
MILRPLRPAETVSIHLDGPTVPPAVREPRKLAVDSTAPGPTPCTCLDESKPRLRSINRVSP